MSVSFTFTHINIYVSINHVLVTFDIGYQYVNKQNLLIIEHACGNVLVLVWTNIVFLQ